MAGVEDPALPDCAEIAQPPVLDEADSFQYGEVTIPSDEGLEDDISEDFDMAMQKLLESNMAASEAVEADPSIERHPEVVDDFIRNFLIKMGMHKTLDSFETEWYELKRAGKLVAAAADRVPDAHRHNAQLSDEIIMLRKRLEKANTVAQKASSTWDTFRKERDFHRMHHKRVMQEKNKLIKDIKQLKAHYEKYEPTIAALKRKYEGATREKSLASIERDRLATALKSLQAKVSEQDTRADDTIKASPDQTSKAGATRSATPAAQAAAKSDPGTAAMAVPIALSARSPTQKAPNRSTLGLLPSGPRRNPYANLQFDCIDCSGMQVAKAVKAHGMGIAHVVLHPRKPVVATASDDCTWRMWQLPDAELIMAGEGHKDWVAGVEFHPSGACLATGSGDSTVKLWDFAEQRCAATLSEHTGAVWAVAFHDAGEVLASCSLDQTIRLWDVAAATVKTALRGHVDSVNEVQWLVSTNTLASASSDKTLSLWDARSGLPTATLCGHGNSVASVAPSLDGRRLASVDADGILKAWDVRMLTESASIAVSGSPLNRVRLDRSARIAVVACDDGQVYAVDVEGGKVQGELAGHEESVQSVALDPEGGFVLSAGSDCSFIVWN